MNKCCDAYPIYKTYYWTVGKFSIGSLRDRPTTCIDVKYSQLEDSSGWLANYFLCTNNGIKKRFYRVRLDHLT